MHGHALLLQLAAREAPAAGVTQGRVRHERKRADMLRLLELPHLPAHRGRGDQQLPEAPDLAGLHVEVGKPAHADRQLHLPRHQVERLVAEHGIHLALGVAPGELGDGRHHRRDAIVQRSGQAQDARRLGRHLSEFVEGIACLLEDGCAALIEEPACVGRHDLAGGAGQQRGAELTFESGDLLADHGLGDSQPVCGGREAAGLHHGCEVGQALEIGKPAGDGFFWIVCH